MNLPKCELCGQIFTKRRDLITHSKYVHTQSFQVDMKKLSVNVNKVTEKKKTLANNVNKESNTKRISDNIPAIYNKKPITKTNNCIDISREFKKSRGLPLYDKIMFTTGLDNNTKKGLDVSTSEWRKSIGLDPYGIKKVKDNWRFTASINQIEKNAKKMLVTFRDWTTDETLPNGWLKRRSNCGTKWTYLAPEILNLNRLFYNRMDIATVMKRSRSYACSMEDIQRILSGRDKSWTEDFKEMCESNGWELTEGLEGDGGKKYEVVAENISGESILLTFRKHFSEQRSVNDIARIEKIVRGILER